jgi:acyl-CoA dehydrogenase
LASSTRSSSAGRAATASTIAVWAEELAAAGAAAGVGSGLGAQTAIATPPIFRFGTPEQHERFLRPAIRGELIGALGITEPGAGSDVASIRTHARRVDGGYVVNGAKTFITNGVRADFLVCAVKTSPEGGTAASRSWSSSATCRDTR